MCGNIRYRATGNLRPICACHCVECRKSSGHYSAATSARSDQLEISGDNLKWYKSSEIAERGFCGDCGSNLFYRPYKEERTSIFCGSIDDPIELKIDSQIWIEEKGDYYELPDVQIIQQCDLGHPSK